MTGENVSVARPPGRWVGESGSIRSGCSVSNTVTPSWSTTSTMRPRLVPWLLSIRWMVLSLVFWSQSSTRKNTSEPSPPHRGVSWAEGFEGLMGSLSGRLLIRMSLQSVFTEIN